MIFFNYVKNNFLLAQHLILCKINVKQHCELVYLKLQDLQTKIIYGVSLLTNVTCFFEKLIMNEIRVDKFKILCSNLFRNFFVYYSF